MTPAVNLIPEHRYETRRRRRRARHWCVGGLLYGVALAGAWLCVNTWLGGGERAIAAQIENVQTQIGDATDAIDLLKPRLADARSTLAAGRSIGDRPDWSILLDLLASLLNEQTLLTSCKLEPISAPGPETMARAYRLSIHGLARNHADVSDYVLRLEEVGLFERVRLLDTRKEPFGMAEAFAFRITCVIGEMKPQPAGAP